MGVVGDFGNECGGGPCILGPINPTQVCSIRTIGFLKGKCYIKVFDRHMELKKQYWDRHYWAIGYRVSTVGLDDEQIRKYVKWQLEKDKRMEQLKLWH